MDGWMGNIPNLVHCQYPNQMNDSNEYTINSNDEWSKWMISKWISEIHKCIISHSVFYSDKRLPYHFKQNGLRIENAEGQLLREWGHGFSS